MPLVKTFNYRLGLIDESLKKLGPQWTGAGANTRAQLARVIQYDA